MAPAAKTAAPVVGAGTGFGTIARRSNAPLTPDTMFALASLTKAMTATGLIVLVDRGLIDLDKPANGYLENGLAHVLVRQVPSSYPARRAATSAL